MGNQLTVLVAGASGALGRRVTEELLTRGHRVKALVHLRRLPEEVEHRVDVTRADALEPRRLLGLCDGVDVAFSCLGASVLPDLRRGRASFDRVDLPANRNLVSEAERAGVTRFVYVSVAGHEELGQHRYVAAHEEVVAHLRTSPLAATVIRPPGFFSAFDEVLRMARRGVVPLIGDGSARTNPIDDGDLAVVCADAVESGGEDRAVGGPDVLTRRQIVELAFEALGRPAKVRVLPPALVRAIALMMRPLSPRVADLTAFYTEVSTRDLIAPVAGTRTLIDYFSRRATEPT